jgi:hypothetical protein
MSRSRGGKYRSIRDFYRDTEVLAALNRDTEVVAALNRDTEVVAALNSETNSLFNSERIRGEREPKWRR